MFLVLYTLPTLLQDTYCRLGAHVEKTASTLLTIANLMI
jgi:hypothetical protein